jgi:hypothetical protein
MSANCPACGSEIVYSGRGRPRRYCESCTPPGSSTSAWYEAWLAEHRDELEAERLRLHAERMAEWRATMRRNRETIAENRRRMEAKQARRAEKAA